MTKPRMKPHEITQAVKKMVAQGPEAENRLIDQVVGALAPVLKRRSKPRTNPSARKTTLS